MKRRTISGDKSFGVLEIARAEGSAAESLGSARGAFSATFGADVTRAFCARNGLKSVVRSHQLPKKQRGFEILHDLRHVER